MTAPTAPLPRHLDADVAQLDITVTRSGGTDDTVVVFIDTTFEPDGSDGGPGLRVRINDDPAYEGKQYEPADQDERHVGSRSISVALDEIAYQAEPETEINLPRYAPARLSDREALDRIAVFMGAHEMWNGGDVCEHVANVLAATGRAPVGDQTPEDLADYRRRAELLGYAHDGEPTSSDAALAGQPLPTGPAVYDSILYGYRGWYDAVRADGTRAYSFRTHASAQAWVDGRVVPDHR